MKHDIRLEEAIRQLLLEKGEDNLRSRSAWLDGPSPYDYEAHVRGTKPFTAEQMAWVQRHPVCLRTLEMFEREYGIAVTSELPGTATPETNWNSAEGRGSIGVDLASSQTPAGTILFLQRLGKGLARVARVDERGRAEFRDLLAGAYRILPALHSGLMLTFAVKGNFAPEEAAGTPSPTPRTEEADLGAGLRASVRISGNRVAISFATENEELEGASVHFAFSDRAAGVVRLSGSVQLERHPLPPPHWVADWQYEADFPQCELVFTVEKHG